MINTLFRRPTARLVHLSRNWLYLHEYQAYDLLKKYQLNLVPVGLSLI